MIISEKLFRRDIHMVHTVEGFVPSNVARWPLVECEQLNTNLAWIGSKELF